DTTKDEYCRVSQQARTAAQIHDKIKLRTTEEDKIEIYCAKRERWLRAKPEEVVRQMFLVWAPETLKYSLTRIQVEWAIQMGERFRGQSTALMVAELQTAIAQSALEGPDLLP